jgi:hypothetical protein
MVEPEIFALNARIEDRHWWFRARSTILLDLAASVAVPDPIANAIPYRIHDAPGRGASS